MLIKSIDFNQCKLLIGHQVTTELSLESQDMVDELEDNPNVSYFSLSSTGVTKSRNYLIKKSMSEFIVFCDDDIQYVPDSLYKIEQIMEREHLDVVTGITLTTNFIKLKNYKTHRFTHNKLSILKVGTVEVVARRSSVENIRFPEDMGAGEKFPICDEPVYLARCIDNNLRVEFLPINISSHPPITSGMDLSKFPPNLEDCVSVEYLELRGLFY